MNAPMSLQAKYTRKQEELIRKYPQPLRNLLLDRKHIQVDIAQHQGTQAELAELIRQQAALEAQIRATAAGLDYLEQEASLIRRFATESGSMPAVPPQTAPPPPSAPPPPAAPPPPPPYTTPPGVGQPTWSGHPSGPMPRVGYPSGGYPVQDPSGTGTWARGPMPGAPGPVRGPAPGMPPGPPAPGYRGPGMPPGPPGPGYQPLGQPQRGRPGGYPGGPPGGYPRAVAGPGRGSVVPRGYRGLVHPPGTSPALRTGKGRGKVVQVVAFLVLGVIVAAFFLTKVVHPGGSGYPANVNQVKAWISTACQNQNTAWENDQQFACSTQGRNILWVFSLISSNANPNYRGKQQGAQQRNGLMPVPAAIDGPAALHLGLNHVISQSNPVDSLQVGALLLNSYVFGSAVNSVQQGLEGDPKNGAANCLRYTGSAAQTTLPNGLVNCSQNLTTRGQLALVEDLYFKWVLPGKSPADQTEAKNGAKAAASLYNSPDSPDANAQSALKFINTEHAAGKLLV